jgi:CubicO group peptidase (beta-lactamase class C family)
MRTYIKWIVPTVTTVASLAAQDSAEERQRLIARAKSLELKTPYVPPPGEPLSHHAAGYAKVMCSAVFVTGLDPEFASKHVGFFTAPREHRGKLGKPVIDRNAKEVHVAVPNGDRRTAKYFGDQGCVTFPAGTRRLSFTPLKLNRKPQPEEWTPVPAQVDGAKVNRVLEAAFADPAAMTAAVVIAWRRQVIGERYAPGISQSTPLESWSMGKSLTATLLGILIQRGVYRLDQAAPIPEWRGLDDPRAKITIADILNMSSGLRIRAPQDPDYDPSGPYPDHLYLYTGGVNSFRYAATRPLQWPPGTVGRYRNTDPVLANYLVRLGVEKLKEEYLSFPQRALFDKIRMQTMVMETDPFGNFLTQGYEYASARDWARLGNLYLNDGVWNGDRILPEGFVKFVSSLAPAWKADGRPVYGGFFWLNGDGRFAVPKEAYYMAGAGGQYTLIVPSHDLVVARLGHFSGGEAMLTSFNRALKLLMDVIPRAR